MNPLLRPLAGLLALALVSACEAPAPKSAPAQPAASRSDPLFVNGGFESGAFAPGWTVSTNLNTGLPASPFPPAAVADLQLQAGGTNLSAVVTNPVPLSQPPAGLTTAPGVPMWPKFGTNTAVVNQLGQNRNVNSLRQTYTTTAADVDPADGKIHVRWVLAPVLQNPGHAPREQPYFFVSLRNLTAPRVGDLYNTFNFSNSPGTPWQTQGSVVFTDWTIFDIAPGNIALQVGDTLELEVIAAGCALSGHWGEVYVDGFGATFPGVTVAKSAPTQVNVDSDLTYTFTVSNNTTGVAPNVTVDDVLPEGTTFVSVNAPGATCTTPAVGGTGTVTCNFGWMNPGAVATFQLTVRAFAASTSGTASAGTATTLTDATRAWAANAWRGYTVFITGGTGVGQQRLVGANTATQLTVSNAFAPAPDATSTFAVAAPPAIEGQVTGANANRIDDSTRAWVPNEWAGWTLYIISGPGVGQSRDITSNTATRLNIAPAFTTTPTNASRYAVKRTSRVINGNYGVAADTLARLLGPPVTTTITAGIPFTDLAITKTDGEAARGWGTPVRYTITVTNNGPLAVSNALVTDALPAQLQPGATWTCTGSAGGSCDTGAGVGNISHTVDLPVGGQATFTIDATIVAGAGTGTLSNTASVAPPAGITDNVPANDADIDIDTLGTLVTLTLNKGPGAGQGRVVSSPAAIDCGNTCASDSASFVAGTSVTLTAVARAGDTFAGWSGGGCSGTALTCTVALAAATTVTANFTGLTVSSSVPGGNGTLVCVPSDVAQGGTSTCTITPASGFALTGLTDNGVDVTASVSGGVYTLTNVTTSHALVATFGALPLTPVITSPASGSSLNNPRPPISGTTSPNVTVTVRVDGVVVCTTTSNGAGVFSCTPGADLANGVRVVTATATNSSGTTPASASVSVTIDTVAPAAPVVSVPANGSRTNDTTPTVSGAAEANSTVTVRIDGAVVGTTTADGSGNWSFTPAAALAEGAHTVNATATDAAGNVSAASNTNSFTVDTTAPGAPVVTAPANGSRTNDTTPTVSGTAEANSTVTVRIDGAVVGTTTADGSGNWSFTPATALAEGAHTVNATATDGAGTVSPTSNTNTFTVDTTAPAAPVITAPSNNANTTATPAISGTAEANSTVTVLVDGQPVGTTTADAMGRWTFTPTTPLTGGPHTLTATARDSAGNTSAPSTAVAITVQTMAPATPTLSAPAAGAVTNDPTPTFTGTGTPGSTATVSVDGAVVCSATVDAMGAFSCTPTTALSDGPRVATVVGSNAAGTSPVSPPRPFTVDTTPPLTPAVVGPAHASRTSDTTPTVSGTGEPGSTITVRIDGMDVGTAVVRPDGTWSFDVPTALSLGQHSVSAVARDAAGNTSLPSNTNRFTVDAVTNAPVVTTPADGAHVATTTPALAGTAPSNATVFVRVDGVVVCTAVADAAGAFSCTPGAPLAEGAHTVTASITDGMGGALVSNTHSFTVDTAAPVAPVVSSPANGSTTADTTPTVTGRAEPLSTVTIFIDGMAVGTTTADATGAFSFTVPTPLTTGMHTVSATSRDRAGNTSPSSTTNAFTVGATSGPTVVTPADGAVTRDTTPTLSGTASPGATVEARVDGMVVCTATAAASGAWACEPTTALAEGSHRASATEQGSSTTSNTNAFTVDSVAPAAPVIVTPADGAQTSPTPTLSGTAEPGARVTVLVDGNAVCVTLADAGGRWSCVPATALPAGMHTVTATATDPAGNVSPPATPHTFSIDATAPAAPVLVTPADGTRTTATRPVFSGTAEPGSLVTVFVDGQPVCRATADAAGAFSCSPQVALALGPHRAVAVARDAAGNDSAASNANGFSITGAPPGAPTITTPAQDTSTKDSTPTITGTAAPNATVTVREGTTVLCTATADAAGAWTCDSAMLSDGRHSITATATLLGADSPPSAVRDFTVDTTPPTTTITGGPTGTVKEPGATVEFRSNEPGTTFECSLDGATFGPCSSPLTLSDLGPGPHVLEVRAVDAAGNTGPVARQEWTVWSRPKGEYTGGCGCTTVEPAGLLLALGAWLARRRRPVSRPRS
jgi:uncharacterized repeat protein (TIGR01451 family)